MNALKRRETEHSRDRQQQILYAIATYTKQHGYPPTVRDIAAEVGFKTPSAVLLIVTGKQTIKFYYKSVRSLSSLSKKSDIEFRKLANKSIIISSSNTV